MRTRRITALAALAVIVLAACGSDAPKQLSDDDFLDTLSDICTTAQRSFDRIDPPQDLDDVEDAAKTSLKILNKAKAALADVAPPDDYSRDFKKFQGIVDDEIDQFTALRDAAADGDEDAAADAQDELTSLLDDQADVASDLDSDDCNGKSASAPADTTPGSAATTLAPIESTIPPITEVPPASTLPVTLPPLTTAPATVPPVITTVPPVITTAPPNTGGDIAVDSVTANFAAPAGYTMTDTSSDIVDTVITGLSSDPSLASSLEDVGVADLIEPSGIIVARIIIAFTPDSGPEMPTAWSEYFCSGGGTAVTTPGGFNGETCSIDTSTSTQNFFTLRGGHAGFVVLSVDPNLDLAGLVDAFFEANPG